MRIVACLRVSALPRPHVHSSVVECRVCHEACWRDLADEEEDGDFMVCTVCLPGYERMKHTTRSILVTGKTPTDEEIEQIAREVHQTEADKVKSLFRALADAAIATEAARAVDHEPVAVCGSRWPKKGPPS